MTFIQGMTMITINITTAACCYHASGRLQPLRTSGRLHEMLGLVGEMLGLVRDEMLGLVGGV